MTPRPIRDTLMFLLLSMAIGAPLAGAYSWSLAHDQAVLGILCLVVYMFSPLLAAVVLSRREGVALREGLGLRFRWTPWWGVAWAVPMAVAVGAGLLSLAMPETKFTPDMSAVILRYGDQLGPERLAELEAELANLPPWFVLGPAVLLQGAVAGSSINAVAAFGEEAGWRGWLHDRTRSLGLWRGSALVGVAWGLWHAPLILQGYNYPEHPALGVLWMTAMCVGLSPILAVLREKTDSSVSASIFHGTFNALAGLPLMWVAGGSDLHIGVTGLAGLLVLALLNLVLWGLLQVQATGGNLALAPMSEVS